MEKLMWILPVLFTCCIKGVLCDEVAEDISGIVGAAVVGFFMLVIVITMISLGVTWNSWYPKLQRWRGRVKIPRHIINLRKKRKEAEKALSEKSTVVVANGNGRIPTGEPDTKSWVEGWNGTTREYEEKDATMNLGEEEEYRIEAEIVDNEALDLGPFRSLPDNSVATSIGESPNHHDPETPVYSVVDRASQKSKTANGETGHQYEETQTSFSAMTSDPSMVIM